MLESVVHREHNHGEDDRCHQDQDCRVLQLVPRGPGNLLREFRVGLLQIVYELSHLNF